MQVTKQPPAWMGFDRFSELDNDLLRYSERYASPDSVVADEGEKMGNLYLLIAKMAGLLNEVEGQKNANSN